ncbi:MAG: arylsulfatase [Tannerella sp.]|jgi:arylsulfatase A-like enzyme|nr:arylsulfatase [Tannerella sp.]
MKKRLSIYPSLLISTLAMAQTGPEQPNIIFILADDLGYGDLSCLNREGKINTPNLDKLAADGVVFTDAHSSSAVSTPTRYGILTGRYNWRSTLKNGVLGIYSKPIIPTERTTMPVLLRSRNYRTACIGKWHLGMNFPTTDGEEPVDNENRYNLDFSKQITGGPCEVGFDYFFGVDAPNYPPYCFIENRQTLDIPDTFYPVSKEFDCRAGRGKAAWDLEQILPALETKAVEYINKSAKKEEPFFLYFPLTSPHTPIVPTSEYKDQSKLNLYADFVMQTDAVVGSIMEALEKNNITGNTLIVFTSDNGCSPRADFDELGEKGHDPSYIFRGMKSDLFEGGHHIPCIVHWPEKIKPHIINQTICLTDFMATFAAITGYRLSDNEGEDSYNLLPLLLGTEEKEIIREATVHHSINGSFTIRKGKWKLLLSATSGGWSEPKKAPENAPEYQLYNMDDDIEEKHNVYDKYPEIADDLRVLLTRYIKEGRSTPGLPQTNDGEYPWKQISWMK